MTLILLSAILGFSVGTLGTIIGAGGGFLLVPMLLFLLPDKAPAQITTLSLFAVACNAISGSLAYAVRGQIHWRSAVLFSLASVPGALLGNHLITFMSPQSFSRLFSGLTFVLGVVLLFKNKRDPIHVPGTFAPDFRGLVWGSILSFVIGFLASFLGIGGGIIHVPMMSEFLDFPMHLATGTSHLILAVTASVASYQNWLNGSLIFTPLLIALAAGIVVGAQLGAVLSRRITGVLILRILGCALVLVSVRLAAVS